MKGSSSPSPTVTPLSGQPCQTLQPQLPHCTIHMTQDNIPLTLASAKQCMYQTMDTPICLVVVAAIAICLRPALPTSHSQTLPHPPTIPQLQIRYSYSHKQYRRSPELPRPLQTMTPLERPRSANPTCSMVLTCASSTHSSYYAS